MVPRETQAPLRGWLTARSGSMPKNDCGSQKAIENHNALWGHFFSLSKIWSNSACDEQDAGLRASKRLFNKGKMTRITVQLFGTLTYQASRSFVVEVPDDVNVATLDHQFLETQADMARIAWSFSNEGFVQTTDFSVEELNPVPGDIPVIVIGGEP